MWDSSFEGIVRAALPFLAAETPLAVDLPLPDYGLDSFGIIELLTELENHYRIRFYDSAMTRETFASPSSLWSTVESLVAEASPRAAS